MISVRPDSAAQEIADESGHFSLFHAGFMKHGTVFQIRQRSGDLRARDFGKLVHHREFIVRGRLGFNC